MNISSGTIETGPGSYDSATKVNALGTYGTIPEHDVLSQYNELSEAAKVIQAEGFKKISNIGFKKTKDGAELVLKVKLKFNNKELERITYDQSFIHSRVSNLINLFLDKANAIKLLTRSILK